MPATSCRCSCASSRARGAKRARETALRRALGASRWRATSLRLLENAILTLAGAAAGVVLARAITAALPRLLPQVPRIEGVSMVAPILAYAAIAATAVMVVLALTDRAGATVDRRLSQALRGLQRGIAAPPQRVFAAVQLAAAVTLLVAAGLLARSWGALSAIDPGFVSDNVLTFRVSLPRDPYVDGTARFGYFRDVIDGLESIPGVRAASMATHVFSRPDSMGRDLGVETDDGVVPFAAESKGVGADYFDVEAGNVASTSRLTAASSSSTVSRTLS